MKNNTSYSSRHEEDARHRLISARVSTVAYQRRCRRIRCAVQSRPWEEAETKFRTATKFHRHRRDF